MIDRLVCKKHGEAIPFEIGECGVFCSHCVTEYLSHHTKNHK